MSENNNGVIDNNTQTSAKNKRGKVYFIISLLNLFIVFPIVVKFEKILLFDLFSSSSVPYYVVLLCGYLFASIIGAIAFLINMLTGSKVLKKCFIVLILSFCSGIIVSMVLINSNQDSLQAKMKKNSLEENVIVYKDDNLSVTQVRIAYDRLDVKLYFKLKASRNSIQLLPSNLSARVNQCVVSGISLVKSKGDLYYIAIPYKDLNVYKIYDIYMVDFNIFTKNIIFKLNSDKFDVVKSIEGNELLYSNDYFKLYFDSNYSSGSANIYFQSLVSKDYLLTFSNIDFDTEGVLNNDFHDIVLYDYSVQRNILSFNSCNENMRYIKFDYVILDGRLREIDKDHVEIDFKNAKISKKYCNIK